MNKFKLLRIAKITFPILMILLLVAYGRGLIAEPSDKYIENKDDHRNYVFNQVPVETAGGIPYEPYQGFRFVAPLEWKDQDRGLHFTTDNFSQYPDETGYINSDGTAIKSGARIKIRMINMQGKNTVRSAENTCKQYPHLEKSLLKLNEHDVCEVQIITSDKQTILAYDYWAHTQDYDYLLTIYFSKEVTHDELDAYISTARTVVGTFKLL